MESKKVKFMLKSLVFQKITINKFDSKVKFRNSKETDFKKNQNNKILQEIHKNKITIEDETMSEMGLTLFLKIKTVSKRSLNTSSAGNSNNNKNKQVIMAIITKENKNEKK